MTPACSPVTRPASPSPTPRPSAAHTPIRFALHFGFRTVVCVITFLVVFSVCEGVKDLLLS